MTGQFASASGSLALFNLATLGVNVGDAVHNRTPRWPALLGIASGAANVSLGAANAGFRGERRSLGILDIAVGSASIAAGAWSLVASRRAPSLEFRLPGSGFALRPSAGVDRGLGPGLSIGGSF